MTRSILPWVANLGLAAVVLLLASAHPARAQADTCKVGFVWRLANEQDHVCVSGPTRAQVEEDNAAAPSHRAPGSEDGCARGYVWREANAQDHVCVMPQTRQRVIADNRAAASRISKVTQPLAPQPLPPGRGTVVSTVSEPCQAGFVWRLANDADRVCVTPQTHAQVLAENGVAAEHRAVRGYGCRPGYVWREANAQDHVCVTAKVRQQTAADNSAASSRIAGASPPASPPSPSQPTPVAGTAAQNCPAGRVWRLANEVDHVCVTAQTRSETEAQNAAGPSHRVPYGEGCIQGYVWRQANARDRVCVTPGVRQQTAADNAAAGSLIALGVPPPPAPQQLPSSGRRPGPPPPPGGVSASSGEPPSQVMPVQVNGCAADQTSVSALLTQLKQAQAQLIKACGNSTSQCGTNYKSEIVSLQFQIKTSEQQEQKDCVTSPPAQPVSFTVTDVSPDIPFGTPTKSDESAGRIPTVVIDPTNNQILYAASTGSGIWKTTDAGHHWKQASIGLRNGFTIWSQGGTYSNQVLAIDGIKPARLMFASNHDDGGTFANGGLYVSTDAASSWKHVVVCADATNDIRDVAFTSGQPFVASPCGIVSTQDPTLLSGWNPVNGPKGVAFSQGAWVAPNSSGNALFVCDGASVYRSTTLGQSWDVPITIGGSCAGISVAGLPQQFTPDTVVVIYGASTGTEVAVVSFTSRTSTPLGFSAVAGQGFGVGGVYAVVRPGATPGNAQPATAFDVFASDGLQYFQYIPLSGGQNNWKQMSGVHPDAWSMAFPSDYDPAHGVCSAYITNDGGIDWNSSQSVLSGGCDPTGGWVTAQSGLHNLETYVIAGISQAKHDPSCTKCPTLYLENGDNDTWVVRAGGAQSQDFNLTGDAGDIHIDPAFPTQAFLFRGLCGVIVVSPDSNPPWPGTAKASTGSGCGATGVMPSNFTTGYCPSSSNCPLGPGNPTVTQVMALPNEQESSSAPPLYFAVTSTPNSPDQIIYSTVNPPTQQGWIPIEATGRFASGSVSQLKSTGGVKNPVLWVLTGSGQVFTGKVTLNQPCSANSNAVGPCVNSWQQVYSTANDVFVDPYDSNRAWVTDVAAKQIMGTTNGGAAWNSVQAMTGIATNGGQYRFDCDKASFFDYACALSWMSFSRAHPNIIVAALFPGGVAYSHDTGKTWAVLPGVALGPTPAPPGNLPGYPISVWYDDNPQGDAPSIYVAMHGNRTVRVDGPFDQLPAE